MNNSKVVHAETSGCFCGKKLMEMRGSKDRQHVKGIESAWPGRVTVFHFVDILFNRAAHSLGMIEPLKRSVTES